MILSIKRYWYMGPFEWPLGFNSGLDDGHFSGKLLELPMRGERRCSPVKACHIIGLLVLTSIFLLILVFILTVLVVVTASGRAITSAMAASMATTLVGVTLTVLAFLFLFLLFIPSFLLLVS